MSYSKTQHTDSTGGESRNSDPSIPSQMLSNFKVIEGHYESVKQFGSRSGPTLSVLIWVQTVCKGYQQMTKW